MLERSNRSRQAYRVEQAACSPRSPVSSRPWPQGLSDEARGPRRASVEGGKADRCAGVGWPGWLPPSRLVPRRYSPWADRAGLLVCLESLLRPTLPFPPPAASTPPSLTPLRRHPLGTGHRIVSIDPSRSQGTFSSPTRVIFARPAYRSLICAVCQSLPPSPPPSPLPVCAALLRAARSPTTPS